MSAGKAPKRSRKAITLGLKLEVIRRFEAGEKLNCIARSYGLATSTVATIKESKTKILETASRCSSLFVTKLSRRRSETMEEMERRLCIWIDEQNERDVSMSPAAIQEQAKRLFASLRTGGGESFLASKGWLEKFKRRRGLHSTRLIRENANDAETVELRRQPAVPGTSRQEPGPGSVRDAAVKQEKFEFVDNNLSPDFLPKNTLTGARSDDEPLSKLEFESRIAAYCPETYSFITDAMYNKMVGLVRKSKSKKYLNNQDKERLKEYDILMINNTARLIYPLDKTRAIRYYAKKEELYDIIHQTHLDLKQTKNAEQMERVINSRYCNIPKDVILEYFRHCDPGTRVLTIDQLSRGQMNVIDISNHRCKFKHVLVYQDLQTRFVFVKSLLGKTPEEVADHLLDIFTMHCPPDILQSSDREFVNDVLVSMRSSWKELQIVHGDIRKTDENIDSQIANMLSTWMVENGSDNWNTGIKFTQMKYNQTVHPEINKSPFQAMFGYKPRPDLRSLLCTADVDFQTEEDIRNYLHPIETVKIKEEAIDPDEMFFPEVQIKQESIETEETQFCVECSKAVPSTELESLEGLCYRCARRRDEDVTNDELKVHRKRIKLAGADQGFMGTDTDSGNS